MNIKLPKKVYVLKKEWTVEYDNGLKSFNPSKLSLHREPEQEKKYLQGTVLAERLKETGMTSNVLQYLWEHQDKIPENWKEKTNGYITFIFFWGTIYRHSGGNLYVRYLYWIDGRWRSNYCWLDVGWDVRSGAAVSASIGFQTLNTKTSLDTLPLGLGARVKTLEDQMESLRKFLVF